MVPPSARPADPELADQVHWRRSARARHVSLRIDPRAGQVVVTLPPRAPRRAGVALLDAHAAWVRASLAGLAPRVPLVPGSTVLLGGAPHRIRRARATRDGAPAWIEPGVIRVTGAAEDAPRHLASLLHAEAGLRIRALAGRHAATLGTAVTGLRLKDTRSRWGSCAPDGTLAFSWRLVMAPDWVLDYVVAHEVAHRLELNHSARFWAHVARLSPHREAAVGWLRAHGPALLRVG